MMPRSFPLLCALLLLGCGDAAHEEADAKLPDAPIDSLKSLPALDSVAAPSMDSVSSMPASKRSGAGTKAQEGCVEYVDASPDGALMVCYTRPDRMAAREKELPGMLETAWQLAWQGAPRSIADEFEHGISTEHVHMPDTLDVEVRHYADCRAKQPFAVRNYRVWRDPSAGLAWRSL